ncbi:MAG: HD domain-containing protein [Acidimicrobiales bacterium]
MTTDDIGKMHFTRMDDGTDADFQVLQRVHEHNLAVLPDLLLGLLGDMRSDEAYPVDRLDHSLQTATRARRDGADDELVVCALLHDIGESLGPLNHGEVVAAILKPFISERNCWVLEHHPLFQTYFYGSHLGIDPDGREQYRDNPYYQDAVDFTSKWDEVSFDPDYDSDPIESFEPLVRALLGRPWEPPTTATS